MMSALSREMELMRLSSGQCGDSPPAGLDRFEAEVVCASDAEEVLARTKEVFQVILQQRPEHWPSLEEWRKLLPNWFVEASGPEQTEAEARAGLERWRSLPPDEQLRELSNERWAIGEFVHWFQPPERECWWWGAAVRGPNKLLICLVVEEPTPSHAALDWLLRAAGAVEIIDENLRDLQGGSHG
jgi:hypothetical protein